MPIWERVSVIGECPTQGKQEARVALRTRGLVSYKAATGANVALKESMGWGLKGGLVRGKPLANGKNHPSPKNMEMKRWILIMVSFVFPFFSFSGFKDTFCTYLGGMGHQALFIQCMKMRIQCASLLSYPFQLLSLFSSAHGSPSFTFFWSFKWGPPIKLILNKELCNYFAPQL